MQNFDKFNRSLCTIARNGVVAQAHISPDEVPLVFAADFGAVSYAFGADRVALDLSHRLAEAVGVSPYFVNSADSENERSFLAGNPSGLIVAINPTHHDETANAFIPRERIITVGIDSFREYGDGGLCDVWLLPCFREKSTRDAREDQLRIRYTCTPSYVNPAPTLVNQPDESPLPRQKTFAVYFRNPDCSDGQNFHYYEKILIRKMFELSKRGCHILTSTGPATPHGSIDRLAKATRRMPGSELYIFEQASFVRSNIFEDYLHRADGIFCTRDTLSGLSDIIHAGKRTWVLMSQESMHAIKDGRTWGCSEDLPYQNDALQLELYSRGYIRPMTATTTISSLMKPRWTPPPYTEWRDIGDQIVAVIGQRSLKVNGRPLFSVSHAAPTAAHG